MAKEKKTMGNVSRAADDIKKKLAVSFMDTQTEEHSHKTVSTENKKSAKAHDKKNTRQETQKNQHISTALNKQISAGNRYKKVIPRSAGAVKAKATFCLDTIALEQLNAVYIKRLTSAEKSDRSSLICEAISLLFEQEK